MTRMRYNKISITKIFLSDELHMNRSGYEIWANILKPILLESELHCV